MSVLGAAPDERDDDVTLVERSRAGEPAAYATLYHRYHPLVTTIVRARLGHQDDPADVVQEVFATAWRGLEGLDDPTRLRPWLAQIARRAAIDHGRRHRRQATAPAESLHHLPDPGPGPDDLADLADLARRLQAGVQGLSRRDALALSMAVDLGLGPAAMAPALGVSAATAKVVLHRARRRLRTAVERG